MRLSRPRAAALCALLTLAGIVGCTKAPGEPGSCRRTDDNTCVAYGAAEGTAGKRMCGKAIWTAGATSCPTGALGSCKRDEQTELLYAGPPNNFTAAAAKTACEFKGGAFLESK